MVATATRRGRGTDGRIRCGLVTFRYKGGRDSQRVWFERGLATEATKAAPTDVAMARHSDSCAPTGIRTPNLLIRSTYAGPSIQEPKAQASREACNRGLLAPWPIANLGLRIDFGNRGGRRSTGRWPRWPQRRCVHSARLLGRTDQVGSVGLLATTTAASIVRRVACTACGILGPPGNGLGTGQGGPCVAGLAVGGADLGGRAGQRLPDAGVASKIPELSGTDSTLTTLDQ